MLNSFSEVNMSFLDDTQDTISAPDNTQETMLSDEDTCKNTFFDEEALLEETLGNVRKIRPRLLEFMSMFGEQQEQIQYLRREVAGLEENLAAFSNNECSRSDSQCVSQNDVEKTRKKRLRTLAKALETLMEQRKASRVSSMRNTGINSMKVLNDARRELLLVQSIFAELEDIYKEEQNGLHIYQQRSERLKEKLITMQKERYSNTMSGDFTNAPCTLTRSSYIIDSYHTAEIVPHSLCLLPEDGEPMTFEFSREGELPATIFRVKERQQYRMRLNFFVTKYVKDLKYVHKTSRLRVNVTKKVFAIGSYSPLNTLQCFVLPPETAPEGLFHRGKYSIKSQILDETGREHIAWHWTLKVISQFKGKVTEMAVAAMLNHHGVSESHGDYVGFEVQDEP